jgi:hypothetical protein
MEAGLGGNELAATYLDEVKDFERRRAEFLLYS